MVCIKFLIGSCSDYKYGLWIILIRIIKDDKNFL